MQNDSWELWNSFRLLCEHDSKLSVALDVLWVERNSWFVFVNVDPNLFFPSANITPFPLSRSTLPSETSLGRWMGESVRAAIVSTDVSAPPFYQIVEISTLKSCESQNSSNLGFAVFPNKCSGLSLLVKTPPKVNSRIFWSCCPGNKHPTLCDIKH